MLLPPSKSLLILDSTAAHALNVRFRKSFPDIIVWTSFFLYTVINLEVALLLRQLWLTDWLSEWLIDWLIDGSIHRSIDRSIDRLPVCQSVMEARGDQMGFCHKHPVSVQSRYILADCTASDINYCLHSSLTCCLHQLSLATFPRTCRLNIPSGIMHSVLAKLCPIAEHLFLLPARLVVCCSSRFLWSITWWRGSESLRLGLDLCPPHERQCGSVPEGCIVSFVGEHLASQADITPSLSRGFSVTIVSASKEPTGLSEFLAVMENGLALVS